MGEIGADDADVAFDVYPDCGGGYVPFSSLLDLEFRMGKKSELTASVAVFDLG